MTEGTTDNFEFVTVEAGDKLPQALTKENWEKIDGSLTALSLTNASGATRVAGEVAVTGNGVDAQSFTVTTIQGFRGVIGVVQETIADDASGLIKTAGHVTALKVDGTTAVGDWLQASGRTSGEAHPSPVIYAPAKGTFAIALTAVSGPGTVEAILIPSPVTDDYEQWLDSNQQGVFTSILGPFGPSAVVTITNDYDLGNGWLALVDGGSITQALQTAGGTPLWTFTTSNTSGHDVGVVLWPKIGNGSVTNPRLRMGFKITTPAVADQHVLAGFCGTAESFADQNDIIAIRANGTGNVFAVCDTSGTETTVDLGFGIDSLQAMEIEVTGESSPVATFLMSGVVVATITTNIPSGVALNAQVGIRTLTTAVKFAIMNGAAVEVSQGTA